MTKQERDDLRAAYFDGTEDSDEMLKLFKFVEQLVERNAELSQETLFPTES